MRTLTIRAIAGALALCTILGCSTTKDVASGDPSGGRWVRPSPMLEQQIEDAAQQLPWSKGLQRLELIRFLATIGEPAYPTLLQLAQDPRTSVSASAYSAMGATGDGRLVDEMKALPWNEAAATLDLALERARALARLGDWSTLPTLIRGLEDERLYTRALCSQALSEIVGENIGFDPRAPALERAQRVASWERWWLKYSGQPMPPRAVLAVAPTAVLAD